MVAKIIMTLINRSEGGECPCGDPSCLSNDPRIEAAFQASSNGSITRRQTKEIIDAYDSVGVQNGEVGMDEVYIVHEVEPYEYGRVLGVFANEELAVAYADRVVGAAELSVSAWTVSDSGEPHAEVVVWEKLAP